MLTVDRGNWTRETKFYNEAKMGLRSSEKYLDKCEIDPSRRPQTLSLKEWSKLHVNLMS